MNSIMEISFCILFTSMAIEMNIVTIYGTVILLKGMKNGGKE